LILYTLNIRANDGLFGSSVGKSVNLVYPDGHFQSYPLAQDGTASIHALARGNYTVQVLDAKGLKQIIPVALSRSQTVDIHVPTNLDLTIIILVGLVVALSLILFGRRQFLLSYLRGNRPVHQNLQNAQLKLEEVPITQEQDRQPRRGIIRWY
jgi:hypothetical protein